MDRAGTAVFYQSVGQARREISARHVPAGGRVRFEIGAYDRHFPPIIDPVVSYSTLLGGAVEDGAFSVALDRAVNIFLAFQNTPIGIRPCIR